MDEEKNLPLPELELPSPLDRPEIAAHSVIHPHPIFSLRSLSLLFLGIIIGIVAAAGGIFLALNSSAKKVPQYQTSKIIPSPTPRVTAKPTSNPNQIGSDWKTYTSSILYFKYPVGLTLEERQKNYIVLLSDAKNPQSVLVAIDARRSGDYASYTRAVSSTKADLTNVQTKEMINGISISGTVGSGFRGGQQIRVALFKYDTAAVVAETTTTNQNLLETFNQILSTFKFKQ